MKAGTKLYISQGTTINLRSSPALLNDNFKKVGTIGDPALGKFIGRYKSQKKGSEGITWYELDLGAKAKFRWIDSRLVTADLSPARKGDQCFSLPGVPAILFDRIAADAKPVLRLTDLTMVGHIESTVSSPWGPYLKVAAKGYAGAFLYIKQDTVITGDKIRERIRQAIANDATLFKTALLIQSQLIEDQKKGIDTQKAQAEVNAYLERFAARQKFWKEKEARGELNLSGTMSGSMEAVWNRIREHYGIGAINWLIVAPVLVVVFAAGSVVTLAIYKSWFETKPTTSSAFDLDKMDEFRRRYDAAKTEQEKKAAMDWLTQTVNDYGKEEFQKGEDQGKESGFLNNLGSGIGKALLLGVGVAVVVGIVKSNQ